jgi:hypothetical protein
MVIQHKKLIGLKETADFNTLHQPLFKIDVTLSTNIQIRLLCGRFLMEIMRAQLTEGLDTNLTTVVPLPLDAEFVSSLERPIGPEAHEAFYTKFSDVITASNFRVQFIIYIDESS